MSGRVTSFFEGRAGRVLVWVLRALLATVFLAAAIPKILDPAEFAQSIDHYRALPRNVVPVFAAILPLLEATVAFALVTGVRVRGAALVAASLMFVFMGAMAQALARDINIECGCFGSAMPAEVSGTSIARNAALALCALVLVLTPARARDVA